MLARPSVTLTAAGEALQAEIEDPFSVISRAVEVLNRYRDNRYRDSLTGRVRPSIPTEAPDSLVGPVLSTFTERYPDVEIEISVSSRMIDVVQGGFDAGIRYDGTEHEGMIAVASGFQRSLPRLCGCHRRTLVTMSPPDRAVDLASVFSVRRFAVFKRSPQ